MGPRSQLRAQLGLGGPLSPDAGRSRRVPALGIAVALSVAVGAQAISLQRTEQLTPVLVAARDLEHGTVLKRADVRIELVPIRSVSAGSLDADEPPGGAVLTSDVPEGEQLTAKDLPGTVLRGRISEKETAAAAPPALVSTRLVVSASEAQNIRPGASVRVVVAAPTSVDSTEPSNSSSRGTAQSIVGASGGGVAQPRGDAVAHPSEPAGPLTLSTPDSEPEPLPDTRAPEAPPAEPTTVTAPATAATPAPTRSPAPLPTPSPAEPTRTAPPALASPRTAATPTAPTPTTVGPTNVGPTAPAPTPPRASASPTPTPRGSASRKTPTPKRTPGPQIARTPKAPKTANPKASARANTNLPKPVATPPVGQVVVSDAKIIAVETPASPQEEISVIIEAPRDSVPALVRFGAEEDLGVEVIKEAPPSPTPSPSPTGGSGGTEVAPSTPDAE